MSTTQGASGAHSSPPEEFFLGSDRRFAWSLRKVGRSHILCWEEEGGRQGLAHGGHCQATCPGVDKPGAASTLKPSQSNVRTRGLALKPELGDSSPCPHQALLDPHPIRLEKRTKWGRRTTQRWGPLRHPEGSVPGHGLPNRPRVVFCAARELSISPLPPRQMGRQAGRPDPHSSPFNVY